MTEKLAQIRVQRAAAFDTFKALAETDTLTAEQVKEYDDLKTKIVGFDTSIKRQIEANELAVKTAQPVGGQSVPATIETDRYVKEPSLVIGGIIKMLCKGRTIRDARLESTEIYGESHPVTKALIVSSGPAGGFMVPPDYMAEVIELLRAQAVVRRAGPRNMPMPRGTMTIPGQASAATANYGSEAKAIGSSQAALGQIIASYKKLTALVPVSNDMMRYANPAIDGFVRDDLVKVVGLREDLAFLLGDGTLDTPRGYLSFANGFAAASTGGSAGTFLATANSTAAVGGNFVTSTGAYTLATVASELGGLVNKMDTANVPDQKRVWFMHPRSKNYLFNVQNSLGVYVYRDEISKGTLLGYPFYCTTQIPVNIWDATGTNKDCSFVFLAEMTETLLLDSMQLELAVSTDGSYVDANNNTISAFQSDQTLIRAITEHDFQLRHDAAVAVGQLVRWAPAIS